MPLSKDDKEFIIRALGAHAALTSMLSNGNVAVATDVIRRAANAPSEPSQASSLALTCETSKNSLSSHQSI